MPETSFVETLELASDDRLRALRANADAGRDVRRGGQDTGAVGLQPQVSEAVNPNLRGAVNAGSIVSFVAGLTETEMTDVLFSTQLAQRAASAKHDRFAETQAWYRIYTEVLSRLGWAGEAFAFAQRKKGSGNFTMDRSALDIIMEIAAGNHLAMLVKTIDKLKGLSDGNGTLRLFEVQALAELSGNFQIGAVQRADNGALSLALGAFFFRTNDARRRVLFVTWGADEIEFWTGAQKLTLNPGMYAKHRAAVVARLSDASDYISALEIA